MLFHFLLWRNMADILQELVQFLVDYPLLPLLMLLVLGAYLFGRDKKISQERSKKNT